MYASFTPPFSLSNGPTGGFFRDGRASSLATQAEQPFVTAFEMANQDAAEVVSRLRKFSLAAYETEDPSFHPLSSKYDYWLQGQAQLTAQEQNGLNLFNNPVKGNCTACHPTA